MRVTSTWALLAAIVAIAATACGGSENEQDVALAVPTASGGQIDLNSLEGRDVLLWFWAPW